MTNAELQSALSTMQHRLNELDRLTEILADVCGAAEEVLQLNWYGSANTNAAAWLSRTLATAYRAGIKPTDYTTQAVTLTTSEN